MESHGPTSFARISNRTLHQEVLEQLRKAILFGQLPVGQRLMETDVAGQMGVSRVPVREAFRQLEREGLVQSYPHRGTVVAAVNDDEVELLYHLRAELEAFAARAVLRRPDAAEIVRHLGELVEAMRLGARSGDLAELAEQDLEFHRAIVAGSRYHTLLRVWRSMDGPVRARLHRALNGPFRQELVSYTAESHQPIVNAMARGDCTLASAALTAHVLETRALVEGGVADALGDQQTDR